jgi:hypothetical protein
MMKAYRCCQKPQFDSDADIVSNVACCTIVMRKHQNRGQLLPSNSLRVRCISFCEAVAELENFGSSPKNSVQVLI